MPRDLCPYCHHHSFNELPPSNQYHHASLEIKEIYTQIHEIDESVATLSQKRFTLLRELNDIQPTTSVLPREILPLIFQFACPLPAFGDPLEERDTPSPQPEEEEEEEESLLDMFGVLQSVSTCWRESFMSAPELWTNVNLNIDSFSPIESKALILLQSLQNSGGLPLTLSFHYERGLIRDSSTLIHPSVDALLRKNLGRVRNLHLTCPPPAWFSESLPYPQKMVELSLRSPDNNLLRNFHPEGKISVSRLTIINSQVVKLPSPSCITVLNMTHIPLDLFYNCLRQCPNVTEVQMRHPSDPLVTGAIPSVTNFTLEHLEILDWTVSSLPSQRIRNWETALLNNIRFPVLKKLCWCHPPQIPTSGILAGSIAAFFERLPIRMMEIELRNRSELFLDGVNFFLLQVFRHVPYNARIERVVLVDCSYPVLSDILVELRLKFPRLREITIRRICWESGRYLGGSLQVMRDAEITLPYLVADLLERRLDILTADRFELRLEGEDDFWWLHYAQQRLTSLKRRDGRLELSVNSKRVHWL